MNRDAAERTLAALRLDEDTWMFLLTKPAPKLVGRRCTSTFHDHEGGCQRPIWGDGCVQLGKGNIRFDLCSRCWRLDQSLHGKYRVFAANPASQLNNGDVNKLRYLPDIGAERPDTFPEEWA